MPRDAFVLKIQRELCHSKCARKVSGLSRNGLLDPLLYLLYTFPLVDIIRKHYMNFHFYADDSLIYSSFDSANAIFVFVGSFSSPDLFIRDISVNIHI